MKRLLSLLICLTLVASSLGMVTFAKDSDHWAYETVKGLVSDGIVSGDSEGNLNLDKSITRAEFIKTINKYFGLTKKADANYPDVASDKWYYNDLLIAKGEGYINGDNLGNANPDAPITRAEVSVIVARLLKLTEATSLSFTDLDEIPSWAQGSIGALCKKGIIKGYEDGTFRASNQVTRGEAFVIIKRNEKPIADENKPSDEGSASGEVNTNVYIPAAGSQSSSSGGGGGGGGGGGSAPAQGLKATLSPRYFDKENLTLEFMATNSSSYFLKLVAQGSSYEMGLTLTGENGTYKYADLEPYITELISRVGINGFDCDIYLMANGKVGYASTSYVKLGTIFAELDIPEVTGGSVAYNPDTDKYDVSWDAAEGVTGYKVSLFTDKELKNLAKSYDTTVNSYSVDTTEFNYLDSFYVAVTAKLGETDANVKGSVGVIVKGFAGGNGTDENPYVIATDDQFVTAFGNGSVIDLSASYLLTGFDTDALELPATFKPLGEAFTGKLIGGDIKDGEIEEKIQIIDFDIETGKATVGVDFIVSTNNNKVQGVIFHKLDGATVKNLKLTGSIATVNTPAFLGALSGHANASTIENVHNYADISGDQAKGLGGLIGWTGGGCTIKGCSNHGDINVTEGTTDRPDVGGIVGNMTGVTISDTYNYGNIKGRDNAGGIAGYSNGPITNCANYGDISVTRDTKYGFAAGISGRSKGSKITECFNLGNITSPKYAAGIAVCYEGAGASFENCFNAGNSEGAVYSAAIAVTADTNSVEVDSCYNIIKSSKLVDGLASYTASNSYSTGNKDSVSGVTAVTAEELWETEISDAYTLLAENENNEGYNKNYRYPQLKNNPVDSGYVFEDPNLILSIKDLTFDGASNKWYVVINPSYKSGLAKYVISLTGVSATVITEFNPDNKYEIENIPDGSATLTVMAYNSEDALLEASEAITADFTFSGGTGTIDSPYIITNAIQFKKAFGTADYLTKAFLLTGFDEEPLVLTDYLPALSAFKGTLIGGNIENGEIVALKQKIDLTLSLSNTDHIDRYQGGIFHKLDGATVKNLALYGIVEASSDITNTSYTGGLVGLLSNSSTLENIDNYMTIDSVQDYAVSGIAASAGGGTNVIKGCRNFGSVTGKKNASGIIGDKFRTTMINCYNYGTITGTTQVGGLVGENKDNAADTIKLCGNFGDVTATAGMAGGIAGVARKNIEQSFNAGVITASTYAGGIVGESYSGKTVNITNCFNLGAVDGTTASGLVIGNHKATSTISYFYDLVNPQIASVCGAKSGTLTVNNAYGFSITEEVKTNDVEKTSKENIKTKFTNESIWTTTEGYEYPDLVDNSVVTNKPEHFMFPE